jgi:predicted lipoprotein with Yx(FWY)xxD motif
MPLSRPCRARFSSQCRDRRADEWPGLAPAEHGAGASEYRLLLAALGEDLRQLSKTQSLERKIESSAG